MYCSYLNVTFIQQISLRTKQNKLNKNLLCSPLVLSSSTHLPLHYFPLPYKLNKDTIRNIDQQKKKRKKNHHNHNRNMHNTQHLQGFYHSGLLSPRIKWQLHLSGRQDTGGMLLYTLQKLYTNSKQHKRAGLIRWIKAFTVFASQ